MTTQLQREYWALRDSAGVLDLSARGRLCLTGADRQRFLNGQVTNNVKDLGVGEGCYAALVNAKGKMQSDLNIYCLAEEILLDFEPGLMRTVAERLEKYIIADDVQIVDVSGHYGMLSVQGPKSSAVVESLGLTVPKKSHSWHASTDPEAGEIYCMNCQRTAVTGFDVYAPASALTRLREQAATAAEELGGTLCSTDALEIVRIEAGIPRFGVDMDEANLAAEAGIEARAISYTKGCYIGQEVISRIRAYGQVAKSLRGLWLPRELATLPAKGERLFHGPKEVGYITSAVFSPFFDTNIALGYVRREHHQPGTDLEARPGGVAYRVTVASLPFVREERK